MLIIIIYYLMVGVRGKSFGKNYSVDKNSKLFCKLTECKKKEQKITLWYLYFTKNARVIKKSINYSKKTSSYNIT